MLSARGHLPEAPWLASGPGCSVSGVEAKPRFAMADESQPVEERAPKRKAKDNPWYWLATLHGQPSHSDDEIAAKNRVTWNRWMASRLPDSHKTALLKKGWTTEELTPLTHNDLKNTKIPQELPPLS